MTNPTPISTASSSDDLVERLRENIIADAFDRQAITSGPLAERLIRERKDAADEIERLRERNSEHEHRYDALEALYSRPPVAGDVVERFKIKNILVCQRS